MNSNKYPIELLERFYTYWLCSYNANTINIKISYVSYKSDHIIFDCTYDRRYGDRIVNNSCTGGKMYYTIIDSYIKEERNNIINKLVDG